jgi:hypothetical protein
MGPENKTTCVLNMFHNLQGLGPSPPIIGANNMIVDSRIINSTFPSTTFRVVMSMINPTYHIRNLLINEVTTTKYTKVPANNGVGPLAVKWSSHLTLRDRPVDLGMHILVMFPPTLNGRLGLISLPQFSLVDWARCRPSRYLIFLLHYPDVDFVFFLVARLNT